MKSDLQVIDLDGVQVLTEVTPIVADLAREIERARLAAGISIEELLDALREQRQRYNREAYGSNPAA